MTSGTPSVQDRLYWTTGNIIPVGLHGDDFRFTAAGQKLVAVSLNFPLGEHRGRYVLFVIRCVT